MDMSVRPSVPPGIQAEAALFAQRRAAIDVIATTRARAIRAALFGAYLFRTNPLSPEDAGTRANWKAILREQYDALDRAAALAQGSDPLGQVPQELCAWIGEHGARCPEHVAAFYHIRDLTMGILEAVESDDITRLQTALHNHFVFGRGGFFETVTEFCDGLWETLDARRHEEVAQATAAGQAISSTLSRLEQIGKHVRLVSLNASVEAARVGDAGRGLGVIAVEFKTLAEEIQALAVTARADIATLTGTKG